MKDLLARLNTLPPWVGIILIPVLSLTSALIVAFISRFRILKQVRREIQRAEGIVEPGAPQVDTAPPVSQMGLAPLDTDARNLLLICTRRPTNTNSNEPTNFATEFPIC